MCINLRNGRGWLAYNIRCRFKVLSRRPSECFVSLRSQVSGVMYGLRSFFETAFCGKAWREFIEQRVICFSTVVGESTCCLVIKVKKSEEVWFLPSLYNATVRTATPLPRCDLTYNWGWAHIGLMPFFLPVFVCMSVCDQSLPVWHEKTIEGCRL